MWAQLGLEPMRLDGSSLGVGSGMDKLHQAQPLGQQPQHNRNQCVVTVTSVLSL